MSGSQILIPVRDYDLAATLSSGQAFRWQKHGDGWEGVVGACWTRLQKTEEGLLAQTTGPGTEWSWLRHYLQTDVDLEAIIQTFPTDEAMRASVGACRGLRLLRQDPWECLASFILSSTKQIVQIKQIVRALCGCFGAPVLVPPGHAPEYAFPTAQQITGATESALRACKMGFRAPNLLATARMVAAGEINLKALAAE